jgi:hypothetical protein
LLLTFSVLLAGWALWRSALWARSGTDIGLASRVLCSFLPALLGFAFIELQPVVLLGLSGRCTVTAVLPGVPLRT